MWLAGNWWPSALTQMAWIALTTVVSAKRHWPPACAGTLPLLDATGALRVAPLPWATPEPAG